MPVRRRKKAKMMIPLASIGDIAFLLIVFFMLVSTFMRENQEFDPATGADLADVEATEISVVLDKDGQLWLQGVEAGVAELSAAVEVLVDRRRRETPVHLSVHRDLTWKDFGPVVEALSDAGARVIKTGQLELDPQP